MVGVVPEYPCYQCGGLAHLIRVKEEGEDLFFEFDWEGYNYKFRRQNLKPIPITNTIFTNLKNITPLRRQFDEFVANMFIRRKRNISMRRDILLILKLMRILVKNN